MKNQNVIQGKEKYNKCIKNKRNVAVYRNASIFIASVALKTARRQREVIEAQADIISSPNELVMLKGFSISTLSYVKT